jgi:hypothetical protein
VNAESAPVSAVPRRPWVGLVALVALEAACLALALRIGWLPAVAVGAGLFALWRLGPDFRWTHMASMLAASVTLYTQGHLTRDLAVVSAPGALAATLALHEYLRRGWRVPRDYLGWALLAWLAIIVWGSVLGLLYGNSLRFLGIDVAGALALGAVVLGPLWRSRPNAFRGALTAFTVLSWISSLFGLAFLLLVFHQRVGDAWFSPIPPMGAMLLLTVALYTPSPVTRWTCVGLSLVPLANVLLSFTRANWMGLLAGMAGVGGLYVWTSPRRGRALARVASSLLLFVAVAGVVLVAVQGLLGGDLAYSISNRFGSSFTTESSGNTISNVIRLLEWGTALSMIRDNPILGYGAGGALVVKDPFLGFRMEHNYIHQMFIYQTFKYGIPGLLALLYLFFAFGRAGAAEARTAPTWRRRAVGAAVFGVTILMFVISMFDFAMVHVTAAIPLAFLWGLVLRVRDREGRISLKWNGDGP